MSAGEPVVGVKGWWKAHVLHASTMTNGSLMIICKTAEQQAKPLKFKSLTGKGVDRFAPKEGKGIKVVIYSASVEISEHEMSNNLKGGNILSLTQMGNPKNGSDSTPILIVFKEEELPKRVTLGYMVYPVRPYERYGHVATVCRGQRVCRRCGDHDVISPLTRRHFLLFWQRQYGILKWWQKRNQMRFTKLW